VAIFRGPILNARATPFQMFFSINRSQVYGKHLADKERKINPESEGQCKARRKPGSNPTTASYSARSSPVRSVNKSIFFCFEKTL
jgi:hypothetical protein